MHTVWNLPRYDFLSSLNCNASFFWEILNAIEEERSIINHFIVY
ncbi:hypothetical protein MANES_05G102401v8 [Manihot esculenta]|uniref:Uncharacterized protein n=1 Tax=Manihot esculenta TaxID=3983 RepID=A0ACB7HNB9_MANES|nr:hypothetical protein MANES_05G102401v8 [Manihot esculenta]